MVKNTKAMSQIVTTVILVVLVLVAIGIVWGVISNLVGDSADDIDSGAKCLPIVIDATAVANTSTTAYDVTITRTAGGSEISGVVVNLFNDTTNSGLLDLDSTIGELETETMNVEAALLNANKIEVTPYFTDASGNPSYCGTTDFNF